PEGPAGMVQSEEVPVAGRVEPDLRLVVIEILIAADPPHGTRPVGAGRPIPIAVDHPDLFQIAPARPEANHQRPVGARVGVGKVGTVQQGFSPQMGHLLALAGYRAATAGGATPSPGAPLASATGR